MIVFFQAEDGIRDLVRSRGLGDVYKRQRLEVRIVATDGGAVRSDAAGGVRGCMLDQIVCHTLSLIHI